MSLQFHKGERVKSKKVHFFTFGALLAVMLLTGCGEQKDDVLVIQDRATARWNALIAGDISKAYTFLSPGYRSTLTEENYTKNVKRSTMKWTGLKPNSIECSNDVCTARFYAQYAMAMPNLGDYQLKGEMPVTEKWIKTEGEWYFLPDLRVTPQAAGGAAKEGKAEVLPISPDANQPDTLPENGQEASKLQENPKESNP